MGEAKRRILTGSALSTPHKLPIELPLVQITLAKDGESDRILTLSPIGLNDYFTSLTMEHARNQPIAEVTFEKLACALQTELTETLRHWIYRTIIGTKLTIVHKWHGPRTVLELLKNLKRDPLGTIDRSKGDHFSEYVIAVIQQQIAETKLSPRAVINEYIETVREAVSPGRPDEQARSMFFTSVVEIAQRLGDKLKLPQRDSDRDFQGMPLYAFGIEMRDLVVDYGNAILDRRLAP